MRKINKVVCLSLSAALLFGFPGIGFSGMAEDYFNRATQFYIKGDFSQARAELEAIQRIAPDYAPANKLITLIKENTGLGLKGDVLLSLDFKDAEITTVLQALSKAYGLNVVAGKDVKGKVTVSFRDISLEQALDSVLTVNGYSYKRSNNIIRVFPAKGDMVTVVLSLQYASAYSVKDMLSNMLSGEGSMEVNRETNALIITDASARVKKIKELLIKIDIPPVQVNIEAKLVDIQSSDLRAIGVKYNIDYTDTDIFGHRGSTNTTAEEIKSTVDLAEESSSVTGGQFVLNTFSIKHWVADATIDALISRQKAHLLASPNITTLNNNEAKIIIGEKVPYREETQTPVGTTETTRFVDVGISLSVTPRVSDDEYITMVIHPEVSSVSELLDAGPRITTREADTVVRVRDGETVVIGGLIKNQNNGVRSSIPILGSIPIIGFLFSNRSEDKIQTELAVFITPHIIRTKKREPLKNKISSVSADALYERAENLIDNLGVETWNRPREEVLIDALATLEQLITDYPLSEKTDDALYQMGLIYYKQKTLRDFNKAKEKFALLLELYPKSKYAGRVKSILKKIARIEKNRKSAKR